MPDTPETQRTGLPIVAVVGRPNVGKSMLFNRITRSGAAVVDDEPGVTRDRNYLEADWNGRRFVVVDTGGFLPGEQEAMASMVRAQAQAAIGEADVVVLVVDRTAGPTAVDAEIAALLRRSPKPILLAANKVDAGEHEADAAEFYSLGLGEPMPVSALHGRGVGDLLDRVVAVLPEAAAEGTAEPGVRVAVVGRPNVGKSSLVNRLVGQDVVIVHDTPGTTRDSIDTLVTFEGDRFVLIDTAGLRRKSHVEGGVEMWSAMRSLKSIERADVAVLVADATEGIVAQDARIAGFVEEAGRGLVVAFNKWDLVEKDSETAGLYARHAQDELAFARHAPVVQISALTGQRVRKVLALARDVFREASRRIPTHDVNRALMAAADRRPPRGGHRSHILYAAQVGVRPPSFVVFVSDPEAVDHAYRRYLANQLRREYGFAGVPIRINVRRRR
jgi:GTP-binding protein